MVSAVFLLLVLLAMPLAAVLSQRQLRREPDAQAIPSHRALSTQAIVIHAVLMASALAAAYSQSLSLNWYAAPELRLILIAIGLVIAFCYLAHIEARLSTNSTDPVRIALRKQPLDGLWLTATCSAAVAEEYVYRGVLFLLLLVVMPMPLAALISALAFALGHLSQGWRGALYGLAFALSMQLLFVLSGALLIPMVSHLCYDLCVSYMARGRKADLAGQA